MKKLSIFHTSFCGSTLLASLISNSIKTYCEPSWTSNIGMNLKDNGLNRFINNSHQDNTLVKYSSVYCYASPHLRDKKVFLYRKLKHHLQKILLHADLITGGVEYALQAMKINHHPIINQLDLSGTHLHVAAYLWVDRFLWMREASNVLWTESNQFFDDVHGTANKVCNHFEIPYSTLYVPFHVKRAKINLNDQPVDLSMFSDYNKDYINPVDAKIVHFTHNDLMTEIIENVQRLFPMIDKQYIE